MVVKRFPALTHDKGVGESASLAILGYLSDVRRYAKTVRRGRGDLIEAVHQLRVGTRRAGAALAAFDDCFEPKAVKKLRRRLRKLRKSAGDARNLDVLYEDLGEVCEGETGERRRILERLLGEIQEERQVALRALTKTLEKLNRKRFWAWVDEHFSAEKGEAIGPSEGLRSRAIARLTEALETFEDRHAECAVGDLAGLHQLRIAGKRLRYLMDVFAHCFGPAFRDEVYATVRRALDLLGQINDYRSFAELFEDLRVVPSDESDEPARVLAELYRSRTEEQRRAFATVWRGSFGPAFHQRFLQALAEPPALPESALPHPGR